MEYLIGDFTMQRCTFYQKLIGNITEMISVKKCQKCDANSVKNYCLM